MFRRCMVISWCALAIYMITPPVDASGQSIVDIYRRQQMLREVQQHLKSNGGRYAIRPPRFLPAPLDTVRGLRSATSDSAVGSEPVSVMQVQRWQRVPKLGQSWFRKEFSDRNWVFLGNDRVTPLDTMMTRDIRARLQEHFGKPTRTLGDFDARAGIGEGEIFEFEYWFVLNDTIPLIITDVNGPFERGVVASTVVEHATKLLQIRDLFLSPLLTSDRRAPYVDYYYDDELVQWYRAGFNGEVFFLEPISSPGMNRPILPPRNDEARE